MYLNLTGNILGKIYFSCSSGFVIGSIKVLYLLGPGMA